MRLLYVPISTIPVLCVGIVCVVGLSHHDAGLSNDRRGFFHKIRSMAAITGSMTMPTTHYTAHANAGIGATTPPQLAPEYNDASASRMASQAGQFMFPAITPPFRHRATVRYTLGRHAWALEQLLTFGNVTATIRSNIIQLQSGGLWVHSPQYPTPELLQLLNDLPGPVEHVVLPCNAFEHKAPLRPFVSHYPHAQVWIAPGQYGPLGSCRLSLNSCRSMGCRVDGVLGDPNSPVPIWRNEFDMAVLYVELPQNAGPVSEVAFVHRPTNTLVTTDAVVYISHTAPAIFRTYFADNVVDDATFWPRTVLQSVFLPLRSTDGATYPGFDAIQGRLVRAPILRGFVDARAPQQVQTWIDQISRWQFDRIVTSHFASPIMAQPTDMRDAFAYLFVDENIPGKLPPIQCQDWKLLDAINDALGKFGAAAPIQIDYRNGCL